MESGSSCVSAPPAGALAGRMPPSTITCATWTPLGPSSRAMLWASARSPNLGDAKHEKSALPRRLAVAPVKIMVPEPRGAMRLAAAWPRWKPGGCKVLHATTLGTCQRTAEARHPPAALKLGRGELEDGAPGEGGWAGRGRGSAPHGREPARHTTPHDATTKAHAQTLNTASEMWPMFSAAATKASTLAASPPSTLNDETPATEATAGAPPRLPAATR